MFSRTESKASSSPQLFKTMRKSPPGEDGRRQRRYQIRSSYEPIDEKYLSINVSGWIFTIGESYLIQYPYTLLGNRDIRNLYYDFTEDELFFDRDPHLFHYIFKYYKTGRLHVPGEDCLDAFMDELCFFCINIENVSPCCYKSLAVYQKHNGSCENEANYQLRVVKDDVITLKCVLEIQKPLRKVLWEFCEQPNSSLSAKIFCYMSCVVIFVSIAANCVETVSCVEHCQENSSSTNCSRYIKCGELHYDLFFILDTLCTVFFVSEYLLRLYAAPKRLKFITNILSIVHFVSILPYFVDIILTQNGVTGSKFMDLLRSSRIIRVFILMRHSRRMKQLIHSVTSCGSELGAVLFIYIVIVLVFGIIIYYAEGIGNDMSVFTSIPEAIWYTVVTTTTLGYGDVVPETVQGKIIGSLCCLMGVLVIALPVRILQMKVSEGRNPPSHRIHQNR